MKKGRGKVEFEDLRLGTGEVATREHKARISYRITLHRGECVADSSQYSEAIWLDLKRRESMAGLRYGIEGMRVGGRRVIRVPPQLGYGVEGLPGLIPPEALQICDVELHELVPTHPITPKLQRVRELKAQQARDGQQPTPPSPGS